MKKSFYTFILINLILHQFLFAGYKYAFSKIFFGRQPSARSEAMGKCLDLLIFDGSSSFFNPANVGRLKGTSLYTSYASPYYTLHKSSFTYYNLATSLDKYGSLALSRYDLNYGEKWTSTNENNETLGRYTTHQILYTLSYAKLIMEDLYFGANINMAQFRNAPNVIVSGSGDAHTYNSYPIDVGVIKQINFELNDKLKQNIGIGISVSNIFKTSFDKDNKINELPVLSRFGISHGVGYNGLQVIDGLQSFYWITHFEYHDLLNDTKTKGFRIGSELSLFELIFLRIGYYDDKVNDYDSPDVNNNSLNEITYGFGIQIPFNKMGILNLPIDISFDYANLGQPSYSKILNKWEDFTTWNIKIDFDFNYFKGN